ncbi:MAG: RluA family pseudouridine synthase [Epsilonproteobacteria bacterium]|nr:RluA family pseudouridine synthase [Campylobacterota bacterium]MBD3838878.1 RluA family pseudouridine synthase [Campylobacterota bacterium]
MQEITIVEPNRLDKALAIELKYSRNQIEKLISDGLVGVNGKVETKRSFKVEIGDRITYTILEADKRKPQYKVDFDVDVLYEDEYMMVINKPANLVVHHAPSVKEATLVDWLKQRGVSLSTISGEERHGIVHRIDKDTTGALVIAKTNEAHQKLSSQLQDKSMGRYYLAIVDYPLKDNGIVDKPIGRNPNNRLKMDIVEGGKEAKSAFVKLLSNAKNEELIAVKLFTGRTHQIRVHLNFLGRHILGDSLYGFKSKKDTINRIFLHAYKLYLLHPVHNTSMEFVAPIFDDMSKYISNNFEEEAHEKINPNIINGYFNPVERLCRLNN